MTLQSQIFTLIHKSLYVRFLVLSGIMLLKIHLVMRLEVYVRGSPVFEKMDVWQFDTQKLNYLVIGLLAILILARAQFF